MSRLFECDHCHEVQKTELNHVTIMVGNCGYGTGEYCKVCATELKRILHEWTGNGLALSPYVR